MCAARQFKQHKNLRDFFPRRFHPSLDRQHVINGTTYYPAAVVHGDLIIQGGSIRYDAVSVAAAVTKVPLPDPNNTSTSTVPAQAKDTYYDSTSTGVCGVRYFTRQNLQGKLLVYFLFTFLLS